MSVQIAKLAAITALSAAGTYTIASNQIVFAQDHPASPSGSDLSSPPSPRSLPIYPEATQPLKLLPIMSPFQEQVAQARYKAQSALDLLRLHASQGVHTWVGWEAQAEGKIATIVSPDEKLNPELLYVGIATLAGSIVGKRNLLFRATLPLAFFALSMEYLLPKTSSNLLEALGADKGTTAKVEQWRLKLMTGKDR